MHVVRCFIVPALFFLKLNTTCMPAFLHKLRPTICAIRAHALYEGFTVRGISLSDSLLSAQRRVRLLRRAFQCLLHFKRSLASCSFTMNSMSSMFLKSTRSLMSMPRLQRTMLRANWLVLIIFLERHAHTRADILPTLCGAANSFPKVLQKLFDK